MAETTQGAPAPEKPVAVFNFPDFLNDPYSVEFKFANLFEALGAQAEHAARVADALRRIDCVDRFGHDQPEPQMIPLRELAAAHGLFAGALRRACETAEKILSEA